MNDHYFSQNPSSAHHEREFETTILGFSMRFHTDAGVFSRNELDPGSRLLIETAGPITGTALDLGCGWGPVGLSLALANPKARFILADVNGRAADLSERNRRANGVINALVMISDGFQAVQGRFDHILTNPPIRAGKQVIYRLFDESYEHLNGGGLLNVVIRKQQGAPSAKAHLEEVFGNCEVIDKSGGYWILRSRKEQAE